MIIIQVVNFLNGGAGKSASNFFKILKDLGNHQVFIFFNEGVGLRSDWYKYPLQVFASVLDNFVISKNNLMFFSIFRSYLTNGFFKNCLKLQPTRKFVFHLHWIPGYLGILFLKRKFRKQNIILTLHDMWFFTGGCHFTNNCDQFKESCKACPNVRGVFQKLVHKNFRIKDAIYKNNNIVVHAPSKFMFDLASTSSLFKDKEIILMPNPINISSLQENNIYENNFSTSTIKLIFVALNLNDKNKNLIEVIDALHEINKYKTSNFELHLIGKGDFQHNDEFGVFHHGFIENGEKLFRLLSEMHYCVISSYFENFPYVAQECMAAGTPLIARRSNAMIDIITPGINGFLYDDIDGLVSQLIQISKFEPNYYRELRKNTFNNFQDLDSQIKDKYTEVLSRF